MRCIDAGRLRNLTVKQTANLTTAFELHPSLGAINPLARQVFTLEFHPEEALEYIGCLFFQLENPGPRGLPLAVPIHGLARLPLLHLNSANKGNFRWNEVPNQHGRIMDFECIGINESLTQQLILTNPTDSDYEFVLNCLDHEDSKKPTFEVSKNGGLVAAGKRTLVDVTFFPYCLGIMESKWNVVVPSHGVVFPLSLNAVVRDPNVSLMPPVVAFKPLLPKMRKTTTVMLINYEEIDLTFQMDMENFKVRSS